MNTGTRQLADGQSVSWFCSHFNIDVQQSDVAHNNSSQSKNEKETNILKIYYLKHVIIVK